MSLSFIRAEDEILKTLELTANNRADMFWIWTCLFCLFAPVVHAGKVLVFPVDGSHWVNMKVIIEELHSRGHQVTVIRRTDSWYIKEISPFYTSITVNLSAADLWLMRVDFVFEFPRPTMPNVVYVGGFQCKPAKPLPYHLEEFVQSSGEHGFIIMSLGTLIADLPADLSEEIAAAFAELPQKVIWRHKGSRPSTLGNNTLLVDWMPQNDLLGHPKIRLFVTHGGTNGIYEAIYHGVPVVGIPIVFDQADNLSRLKAKRVARTVEISDLDRINFQAAIQDVLNEPSYRMNMQRLSRLHRDQPMRPLDTALFWIEFVMRHKGAAHLRTESYKLPWYSYHSVDVIVFLLTVTGLLLFLVFGLLWFCFRLCFKRKEKKE
ncbi:hypothetical protein OJAV_G00025410 [Oryzias javanicus]|uniref:UDP-glucuronosyltransferase n=1 Tax=Oryzias javanicus TaxID=123683 RepID=A0A3S2N6M4_ORYJA|nr:hypothetical protein OJAV_G00025410 [Oryzias javanicus]